MLTLPKNFWKVLPITFICLFIVNFIFQGLVLRSWNDSHMNELRKPPSELTFWPMILDYVMMSAVLSFIWLKAKMMGSSQDVAVTGAAVGGVLFLHIGLINYFILANYPVPMVISDTLVSVVAFGLAGLLVQAVYRKFLAR